MLLIKRILIFISLNPIVLCYYYSIFFTSFRNPIFVLRALSEFVFD